MKKIIYIIFLLFVISSFISCDLDNFDGPNTSVYGALIDAETGQVVEQEIGTSGDAAVIQVIEYGYKVRQPQSWKIMRNGEYRNDLVFSGIYDVILIDGNFIPLDTLKEYQFKKTENLLNFEIIPNIRIKNAKITKVNNAIEASFNLEFAHNAGKIERISLLSQEDMNPSNSFHLSKVEKNINDRELRYANRDTYKDEVFSLVIDLDSDEGKKMRSGKSYFFRVGAKPTDLKSGRPDNRFNYSQVVELKW